MRKGKSLNFLFRRKFSDKMAAFDASDRYVPHAGPVSLGKDFLLVLLCARLLPSPCSVALPHLPPYYFILNFLCLSLLRLASPPPFPPYSVSDSTWSPLSLPLSPFLPHPFISSSLYFLFQYSSNSSYSSRPFLPL